MSLRYLIGLLPALDADSSDTAQSLAICISKIDYIKRKYAGDHQWRDVRHAQDVYLRYMQEVERLGGLYEDKKVEHEAVVAVQTKLEQFARRVGFVDDLLTSEPLLIQFKESKTLFDETISDADDKHGLVEPLESWAVCGERIEQRVIQELRIVTHAFDSEGKLIQFENTTTKPHDVIKPVGTEVHRLLALYERIRSAIEDFDGTVDEKLQETLEEEELN